MAKKTKDTPLSFSDFDADDSLLNSQEEEETQEEENEEEEEESEEEEEQEEEEEKPKKQPKTKKVPAKKKEEEPEEDEEEEEEQEEEEEDVKDKTKTGDESEEEEEEEDDSETATKFFEQVEKITGRELDIDYGDVNPLSPQGVALREQALVESTLDNWLEEIETKFPQVFQALQHANNGGNPAELFTQTAGRDYTKVELKDTDEDLAKDILKDYFKGKGVKSEEKIKKLIEAYEDSENGLVKEAQIALDELRAEQEDQRSRVIEEQKKKADEQKKKDSLLVTAIDEVIESKKLGNFKITDRVEARQFKEFLIKSVRRTTNGGYELATPVDSQNLEKILQYQFFQFKNGDLSKIIQQGAATVNAEKLKLKLKTEQSKTKKNTNEERQGKLSLKDF